jgi:hypothetical protein
MKVDESTEDVGEATVYIFSELMEKERESKPNVWVLDVLPVAINN